MRFFFVAGLLAVSPLSAHAAPSAEEIEGATYDGGPLPDGQSAITARVQVLLDRADISPGVIDGYRGGMTTSAISAFETREGLTVDGKMDEDVWARLGGSEQSKVTKTYQVTEQDLGQVTGSLPDDYAKLAEKELLGFADAAEALAEKFHLDVEFLRALNPESDFSAGSSIKVLNVKNDADAQVASIEIDKSTSRLIARTQEGNVVANYPVTVGSGQTPSPEGKFEVTAVAIDPTYSYNPDVNFQQGDNSEPLTLPPGPNGPVGTVWIDLNKPTFGIHGTPDPARLFSEQSHGCVRMTNWDARELAGMVTQGVTVAFKE